MTRRVDFDETALDQAAGSLTDDPAGLRAVLDAVDQLVADPRRLRVGRYRVLYEITDDAVSIVRIARVEATG